jgi:hypothetical protein
MTRLPAQKRRKSQCPPCHIARGYGYYVKADEGQKVVKYRCPVWA